MEKDATELGDKEELPEQFWEATNVEFHQHIDKELKKKKGTFDYLLGQGDSTQFWGFGPPLSKTLCLNIVAYTMRRRSPRKAEVSQSGKAPRPKGLQLKRTIPKDPMPQSSHLK